MRCGPAIRSAQRRPLQPSGNGGPSHDGRVRGGGCLSPSWVTRSHIPPSHPHNTLRDGAWQDGVEVAAFPSNVFPLTTFPHQWPPTTRRPPSGSQWTVTSSRASAPLASLCSAPLGRDHQCRGLVCLRGLKATSAGAGWHAAVKPHKPAGVMSCCHQRSTSISG